MIISRKAKIILLIFTLLIFILFIVFIGLGSNFQKTNINTGFVPPNIPNINQQSGYSLDSSIKESDFNFPSSLPILESKSVLPLSLDESKSIANTFGFTGAPQTFNDVTDGTVYFWSDNTSNLDITAKTRVIKYNLDFLNSTSPTRLTEKELIDKAKKFLLQKNLITDTNPSVFVNYYKFQNPNDVEGAIQTNITNASFVEINFSVNSLGYKILTLDPTKSAISVRMLPDGIITEIDLIKTGDLVPSIKTYAIKSFSDFQSTLKQATILSLNDGELINPDPQVYKIKSVIANNIELVYFTEAGNISYFQPVFLIKGTADVDNLGKVSAYMYLNAFR